MLATPLVPERTFLGESVQRLLDNKRRNELWTISPEASVYQAIQQMSVRHVGALIVSHDGELAGIVSERDYARRVILMGRNSKEARVRDIMTSPVMFVSPRTSIDDCMRLMTTRKVRHLPVVENGTIAGVLSMGDIVNWVIESQDETIHRLQEYIAGTYPA